MAWGKIVAIYWERLATVFLNCLAAVTVVFCIYVIWVSVTQKIISVAPIAVPKTLEESGYTSDVAAMRLESAIRDTIEIGHLMKTGPGATQQSELPKIVVPSTGWSIDVIAQYIRSLLRIEGPWNVSGDITNIDKKLWLHLRMNGQDLFETPVGIDPDHPDDLFGQAARQVIGRADPYILAAAISRIDPGKSIEILNRIVSFWPVTGPNVAWAHILRGNMLSEQGKDEDAIRDYFEMDPRSGTA